MWTFNFKWKTPKYFPLVLLMWCYEKSKIIKIYFITKYIYKCHMEHHFYYPLWYYTYGGWEWLGMGWYKVSPIIYHQYFHPNWEERLGRVTLYFRIRQNLCNHAASYRTIGIRISLDFFSSTDIYRYDIIAIIIILIKVKEWKYKFKT